MPFFLTAPTWSCLHSQDGSSFLLGGCDQLWKQQVWTNTLNYCLFAVLSFTY